VNERARRIESRLELPVLAAAVLVIPVIAIEQSVASDAWRAAAAVVNWAIWIVFAFELVATLAVADDGWAWLRAHPLELANRRCDATVPAREPSSRSRPASAEVASARAARFTGERLFSLEGLRYAAFLTVVTALGGGAAFAATEDRTTWDGVWWAVVTMTTVGYGDLSPETDAGKAIAMVVMLVGIGFIRSADGRDRRAVLVARGGRDRAADRARTG
jgi:voltage-gated potassium channel